MQTLGEAMKVFMEQEVAPYIQESSYRTYEFLLQSSFYRYPIAEVPVEEIGKELLREYYLELLREKSRGTVMTAYSLVSRLLSHLYESGILERSVLLPLPKVRERASGEARQLRREYFREEDLRKLFEAFEESRDPWLYLVIFQLETFVRAGEAVGMKYEAVDLEERLCYVRNTVGKRTVNGHVDHYLKPPKNGRERIVPLSDMAVEAVKRLRIWTAQQSERNPKGLLFPKSDGGLRRVEEYERSFKRICKELSIDRAVMRTDCIGRSYTLSTHALRHTGISYANSAENANPINTALMAGHSVKQAAGVDIGTDSRYTHALLQGLRSVKTPSMLLREKSTEEKPLSLRREDLEQILSLLLQMR